MSGTRDVQRTYRVVIVDKSDIESFIDYKGTRLDFESRNLLIYNGDRVAAIFAEGIWKHVREFEEV